ncbi:carbohydrate ABC transporter permease [Enterococcus sp. S86.2]|uniref:carbohydrate ABC transporter permease n=1 Tax=Enterococcus sp. S86.2 TaxID=3031299 RepID=UPI0026EEDFF3|nr:sugar ABC transporter permease [Enterococcus sp. S86.2]
MVTKKIFSRESTWGYIFVLPLLIGFSVFMVYPLVSSLILSFTDSNGINLPNFVGLKNYVELLKDDRFKQSLFHTLIYVVGTVPVGVFLSLLLANVLNNKIKGKTFFRTAFMIPYITSMVAIATVWKWLFNTEYGVINNVLEFLNLYQPPWLTKEGWAMFSLIIVGIWKGLGYNMILYLAGLQNISESIYEAAEIDGANAIQKFFRIKIPLLRNTTIFVTIMSTIGSFQVFDLVYVMTNGGPANSTSVIVYYIYQNSFIFFKQGYASAAAYILFIIILIITAIQFGLNNRGKD